MSVSNSLDTLTVGFLGLAAVMLAYQAICVALSSGSFRLSHVVLISSTAIVLLASVGAARAGHPQIGDQGFVVVTILVLNIGVLGRSLALPKLSRARELAALAFLTAASVAWLLAFAASGPKVDLWMP